MELLSCILTEGNRHLLSGHDVAVPRCRFQGDVGVMVERAAAPLAVVSGT